MRKTNVDARTRRRTAGVARFGERKARAVWVRLSFLTAWGRGRSHPGARLRLATEPRRVATQDRRLVGRTGPRITQPREVLWQARGWAALVAGLRVLPLVGVHRRSFAAPACLAHEQRRRRGARRVSCGLLVGGLAGVEGVLRPQATRFLLGLAPAEAFAVRPHRADAGRLYAARLRAVGLASQVPLRRARRVLRWPERRNWLQARRRGRRLGRLRRAARVTPPDVASQLRVARPLRLRRERRRRGRRFRQAYGRRYGRRVSGRNGVGIRKGEVT